MVRSAIPFLVCLAALSSAAGFAADDAKARLRCATRILAALAGDHPGDPKQLADGLKQYSVRKFREAEQDASLKKNLEKRGYACGKLGGYACLKKLSAENVTRLLDGFDVAEARKDPDLDRMYRRLEAIYSMHFVHNSHHLDTANPTAVLSGKRLASFGADGAGQSGHFNDKLLGGADQVFFFPYRTFKEGEFDPKDATSIYGPLAAVPEAEYAEKFGWISPFVMYRDELSSAAFVGWGQRLKRDRFGQPTDGSARNAIAKLHQLDFTVTDFMTLDRAFALRYLQELKQSDPEAFQKALKHATTPPKTVEDQFIKAAAKGMGTGFSKDRELYMSWEFKIPVAVPESSLSIH